MPDDHGFAYQPLWPFRTEEEAKAWQAAAAPGGHQPWHLDLDTVRVPAHKTAKTETPTAGAG